MRLRVWTVAAFDTLRFLAGSYTEPTHMRLPLRNAECRKCHTPILKPSVAQSRTSRGPAGPAQGVNPTDESSSQEAETEGRGSTSYHAIREHETVRITCVRCHTSHTTDSDAANRFISRATVVPMCRECHKTL
jgi:predicted CXXCH cytochrome family protein